jgi:hypothetical protein
VLLRYVKSESEKKKATSNDDDDEDDKDVKYVRKWYTPWKKVKVSGGQFKVSWEIAMRMWPCSRLGGDHDRTSVEQWLGVREIM